MMELIHFCLFYSEYHWCITKDSIVILLMLAQYCITCESKIILQVYHGCISGVLTSIAHSTGLF